MKLFILSTILILGCIIFPRNTHGQAISLEITPQKYTVVAKPGARVYLPFRLENFGDPTIVKVRVVRLRDGTNTDTLNIRPAGNQFAVFEITNTAYQFNDPFLITPNETIPIPVYATIRTDIEETDYRFGLLVETVPPQPPEGEVSLGVHGTVISPLLFQVTADAQDNKDFRITLFDVRPQFEVPFFGKTISLFNRSTAVPLVVRAQNGAKHSVELHGSITTQNSIGSRDVYNIISQRVPAETDIILQGSEQQEACIKNESSALCNDDNTLILSDLASGYYTASATVYDRGKSQILTNQTTFLVLPIWWIVFGLTGILCILTCTLLYFFKRKQIESYIIQKRRQKRRTSLKP
jgi:hypothetical protein